MAPNFSKNAILKGDVDLFCLVCEAYFTNNPACEAHLLDPDHKKKFSGTTYVEEFKQDFIRKIKNKYFCELCNKLLPLLVRVRLHIVDTAHIENKNVGWLKRVANNVIAFDKLVIDEAAWHGVYENSCTICNVEYDDSEVHKKLSTHILNLLELKVNYDSDENVYRQIDQYSFQCLTCNLVENLNIITNHFESPRHRQLFQVSCETYLKSKVKIELHLNETKADETNETDNPIKEVESDKFRNNHKAIEECHVEIKQINLEALASNPKIKDVVSTKPNNVNPIEIVNPEKDEQKENPKNDCTMMNINDESYDEWEAKICKVLDAEKYISCDENNRKWCLLCDWKMDVSRVKEHLNGQHHQTILKMHKKRIGKLELLSSKVGSKQTHNTKPLDSNEFEVDDIVVNFELKTATCKRCSVKIEYDDAAIENHILEHNKKDKGGNNEVDSERKDSIKIKDTANNDSDDYVDFGECDETDEDNNEKPGEETTQIQKIKIHKESTFQKIQTKCFIKHMCAITNAINEDFLINHKFCINNLSFFFITHFLDSVKMKCYVCDEVFLASVYKNHCCILKHELAIWESPILIQFDTEFIREPQPGRYHCGFCNKIKLSWVDMEMHLNTSAHNENKNNASWRLQRYQSVIDSGQTQADPTVVEALHSNILTRNFF